MMRFDQFSFLKNFSFLNIHFSAASMMHNTTSSNNGNADTSRPVGLMGSDSEDLRVPNSLPFMNRGAIGGPGGAPPGPHPMAGHPGMGSALLDSYLSMIAAAGGDSASMAAALGLFPGRAAACLGKISDLKTGNGKDQDERSASEDREDEAIASDADISDTEDGPDSVGPLVGTKPQTNDDDSIAAEDN